MRYPKPRPVFDPANDEPEMKIALAILENRGIRFERKTLYQIKIGDLSYYPRNGTIYRDGDPRKMRETGLPDFITLAAPNKAEDVLIDMLALADGLSLKPYRKIC